MSAVGKPSKDKDHPDWFPSSAATPRGIKRKNGSLTRYDRTKKRKLFDNAQVKDISDGNASMVSKNLVIADQWIDDDTNENSGEDNITAVIASANEAASGNCEQDLQAASVLEMRALRDERDEALKKVATLEKVILDCRLNVEAICHNDDKAIFYTGLSSEVFQILCQFVELHVKTKGAPRRTSISLRDQIFLTVLKLRYNIPFQFIAYQRAVGLTTITEIFWNTIDVLYSAIGFCVKQTDRECLPAILPPSFKQIFPRLTHIIDCFKICIDQPKNLKARAQTYSNYKHHNTVKVFIACNPRGAITFVSSAWGGRQSDVELVRSSGFISNKIHMPGDQILADRGFTLQDDFASACGAHLIQPAFTRGKKQLSAEEVESSRKLSSVRLHIERIIGCLRRRYTILRSVLPISILKSTKNECHAELLSNIDKIVKVCAALTNLRSGII